MYSRKIFEESFQEYESNTILNEMNLFYFMSQSSIEASGHTNKLYQLNIAIFVKQSSDR